MHRGLILSIAAVVVTTASCGSSVGLDAQASHLDVSAIITPAIEDPVAPRGVDDPAGIQRALDLAAAAFRDGDVEALRSSLHDPGSGFGQRWVARVSNMSELPIATYELRLEDSLPDLATDGVRQRHDGEQVQVVYVEERLALSDFDEEPAVDDLFLTVVKHADGWRFVGDRDAELFGFVSVDHLWDHGPVSVTVDGPIMAIHHPDGPEPGPLVEEARRALRDAAQRWPLTWPERVPIIVPRDEEELGELLHVTFDLSNFIAFATSTSSSEGSSYEVTGSRIIVNPVRFLGRSTQIRERILVHELVHVATRPVTGPMLPSWLEEGVAQALGEQQSTTGTALLNGLAGSQRSLPTAGEFTVGGRDRIFLSYQLAWSFVDHLLERYSTAEVGSFYAAAGRGALGRPGTTAHHLDRASLEVFGTSFESLVDDWRTAG